MACAIALGSTVALVASADQLLGYVYGRFRPGLEQQIGQVLGHPLRLGDFRGFGWSGLRLGPTRVLPVPGDGSSLSADELAVSLDPLASLRQRLPVLHLSLAGLKADLRRNAQGRYWVPGTLDPAIEPPRLDLRLRLSQPAVVTLAPAGVRLALDASAGLRPHRRELDLLARIRSLDGGRPLPGSLRLKARGDWSRQIYEGQLLADRFPLQTPARLAGLGGRLDGQASGRLQLAWRQGTPDCQGEVRLRNVLWKAPGSAPSLGLADPALGCEGQRLRLAETGWRWGDLDGRLAFQALWRGDRVALEALELRRRNSWLRARGEVGRQVDLRADWQLNPAELPLPENTPVALLGDPLRGRLRVRGAWPAPLLETTLAQGANPLVGGWDARLRWSDQRLRLERLASPYLTASGSLPLRLKPGEPVRLGPLDLQVALRAYPLPRLGALVGTSLEGVLEATGTIRGPLSGLTPDFDLRVQGPGAGPLKVAETWEGSWSGDPAGGGRLAMALVEGAGPADLQARLDRRWVPVSVVLQRHGGELGLEGAPRAYRWRARSFPLEGLLLALGPRSQYQPLRGLLSGQGDLELQPLAFSGTARLEHPVLLGVWARQVTISGQYTERRYEARLGVEPLGSGNLAIDWSGRWKGPFQASITGRELGDDLVRQMLEAWPRWQGDVAIAQGTANDLGSFLIDTLGGSLDGQLTALDRARAALQGARQDPFRGLTVAERLDTLSARFDLDARLEGPRLVDTRADLTLRGHLWLPGQDRDLALTEEPVRLSLQGPFRMGEGQLSFSGLPLALMALLTPVPEGLRGSLGATGRYRLGAAEPELSVELALVDAAVGKTALRLERGAVRVAEDTLTLDLAARADGAANPIELAGSIPLNPAQEGVELRLASREDGLRFLTELAQPGLVWKAGSADLQLLVRGSLEQPIANGFLRFRDAQLEVVGQSVENLQATVLFDFEQLFLQDFSARVGKGGELAGSGSLGLLSPATTETGEPSRLQISLKAVPFVLPRIKAVADGSLAVAGSLASLDIGGELAVSKGSINVQPGQLETGSGEEASSVSQLVVERWNFKEPLVLFGPDVESQASEKLRAQMPRFRLVGFDDLRLTLGPDLAVGVPNLASFNAAGLLRIDGRLDPSLQARGVVRLERGRLTLFTTTFNLDPDAPNVAVFTPSSGLIPYLDIALRTRVSDSLSAGGLTSGLASSSYAPSLTEIESQGGTGSLDQLNLVRVYLGVSGPADRLADNLTLRSSPPLPEERLLALIGGNSLAGLVGGGAGAALATVVGQSLLSPVLGTLSDAFGQRLSFALYPAYVNQAVDSKSERRSERVPPQLVLGAEIGLDITERFNASLLAAPNRTDVPPQLNLNFKASELINIQGSVDSQGIWQTQLQVFFRF
ncbi:MULTISPECIES: translocation/assembly module TamB domain-containing protein [Aphanothece]|uniref:translocation/assembly module TamB domain-containing protein n=1 Tax=Aphanothece TaxID=1121 RepID=UPI00398E94E6